MTQTNDKQQAARVGLAFSGGDFVAASEPDIRDGQPVRRFRKDLISAGTYRHPGGQWTLEVTPERMDRWVAAFGRMRDGGVDVEVVVDHRMDAEAVRGYLVGMDREGDTLYGVHELIGEDAIRLASTVKNVSVLIEKDFRDGQGRSYGEAITHSSIVQQPLVPGQKGFVPIAASRGGDEAAEILLLSRPACLDEQTLLEVREMLGADADVTAETALPLIRERLSELTQRLEKLAAEKPGLVKQAEELTAHVEQLQAKLADADDRGTVDPESLEVLAEGVETRIDGLVERGRLAPAAAAMARELLVGAPGERNVLMLSRRASRTSTALAREVLGILEANVPTPLGEQTGPQAIALGRIIPDESESDHDPTVTKSMIASAGTA
jgi:hypothetical protein